MTDSSDVLPEAPPAPDAQREREWQELLDAVPAPVIAYDPDSLEILFVNTAAIAEYGYGRDEFLALTVADLRPPEDRPAIRAFLAHAREEPVHAGVWRHRRKDGSVFDVEVMTKAATVRGRKARISAMHDVSERLRATRALAENEARLHAVLSHAPVVIFALDENGVFTLSEGSGLEAVGLRPGQVVGLQGAALYGDTTFQDPAGRTSTGADVLARVLGGTPYVGFSSVGRTVFDNRINPMLGPDGRVVGAIGIATDVSESFRARAEMNRLLESERAAREAAEAAQRELRESAEQLRQAQKMEAVGRLAGGIAHDFNNILTVISSAVEFALENTGPADAVRPDLLEVRAAARRAATLTGQLLAFSRRQVLQPQVLDLGAVVRGTQPMLARLLGAGVDLDLRLPAAPACVKVDRGQIEQVILNLALNARDAMNGSGVLSISVSARVLPASLAGAPQGAHVMLAVRDTGAGMGPDVLGKLFEPFFTTKEVGRGTGLGLATALGIVQQSGGHITVDSAPGQGSTFRVFLPEHPSEDVAPAASSPPPQRAGRAAGEATILIAEDESAVRKFAQRTLTALGYRVLLASSGDEALAVAAAHPGRIDLLLTDVIMPGLPGPALARQLRAERPELRVLFVSGYLADELAERGILEPSVDLVMKPVLPDELARRVVQALDR